MTQGRVIGTGVLLDYAVEEGDEAVAARLFAEVEVHGEPARTWGTVITEYEILAMEGDPTTALLEHARFALDSNLGGVLEDLRRALGLDVTRFEFYAAPCRIELSPALRSRLRGRWRDRDPGASGEGPPP